MAKVTLGLGFNFFANPGNSLKTVKGLSNAFNIFSKKVKESEKGGRSFFETVSELAKTSGLAAILDKLSESTENLGGRLSGELNSVIKLGSGVQEATAQMGLMGAEAKAVEKAMYGLELSAITSHTEVAELVTAFEDVGISIKNNAELIKKYARISEGLGIDSKTLASIYGLSKSMNISVEQTDRMIDSAVAVGKTIGNVSAGVDAFKEALETMTESMAFKKMSNQPGQIQEWAFEITKLSSAVGKTLGVGFDKASKSITEFFGKFVEGQKDIKGMLAGIKDEFPDIIRDTSVLLGNVEVSMEALQKSPMQLMELFTELFKNANKTGNNLDILRARFQDIFDDDMTRLFFDNLDKFGGQLTEVNKTVKVSAGLTTKLTNKALNTTERQLEALNNQMEYQIGLIKLEALPIIIKAMKSFRDGLVKVRKFFNQFKKEHPKVFEFFKRLIAYSEIGGTAFLSMTPALFGVFGALQAGAVVFDILRGGIVAVVGGLKGLLGVIGKVGKPLAGIMKLPIIGVLGKVFFWIGLIVASVKPLINLIQRLKDVWGKGAKDIGERIIETIKSVVNTLWEIFDNFLFSIPSKIFGFAKSEAGGLELFRISDDTLKTITNVMNKVSGWILNTINTVFNTIIDLIPKVFSYAVDIIERAIPIILTVLDTAVNYISNWLPKLFDKAFKLFVKLLDRAVRVISNLVPKVLNIIVNLASKLMPKLWDIGMTLIMNLFDFIVSIIPSLVDLVINAIEIIYNGLVNVADTFMNWVTDRFVKHYLPYIVVKLLQGGINLILSFVKFFAKIWIKLRHFMFGKVYSWIKAFIYGIIKVITSPSMWKKAITSPSEFLSDFWDIMSKKQEEIALEEAKKEKFETTAVETTIDSWIKGITEFGNTFAKAQLDQIDVIEKNTNAIEGLTNIFKRKDIEEKKAEKTVKKLGKPKAVGKEGKGIAVDIKPAGVTFNQYSGIASAGGLGYGGMKLKLKW